MKPLKFKITMVSLFPVLFLLNSLSAQTPEKMSYQAVIRDASNTLIVNTSVGMQISILQGSITGTVVYAETHTAMTNANGLVSIEIGGGTVVTGSFAVIDWANGPYFIKSETDPTGGTAYSITGTTQLMSVPYAMHAKTVDNVTLSGSGFVHYIGEQYGGGVVFHLYRDAGGTEHGLVVTLNDQSSAQDWSNVAFTAIGAPALSYWDGINNSTAIVGQASHTASAAELCVSLNAGGQTDWYLPSLTELNLLWNNLFNVNMVLSSIGGATEIGPNSYWSSCERVSTSAWQFNFSNGGIYSNSKNTTAFVRAIRTF